MNFRAFPVSFVITRIFWLRAEGAMEIRRWCNHRDRVIIGSSVLAGTPDRA